MSEPPSPLLYVEVEDGERVVLPRGMTEAALLKSMLRQLLAVLDANSRAVTGGSDANSPGDVDGNDPYRASS